MFPSRAALIYPKTVVIELALHVYTGCLSSAKQTTSSSHPNVTCFRYDNPKKIANFTLNNNHSLKILTEKNIGKKNLLILLTENSIYLRTYLCTSNLYNFILIIFIGGERHYFFD
jgi:hypothetical protein